MTSGTLMMDLMRAFTWFDERLQASLRARGWPGVSRSQSITLVNIALGIDRPADLARNLGISRQAMSVMLKGMADAGMLAMVADPADRRASIVMFHARSLALRTDALQILAELEQILLASFGEPALDSVRSVLGADWASLPAPR